MTVEIKDYVELSLKRKILAFASIAIVYFFYCYNFSITAVYTPVLVDNYGFSSAQLSNAFALMSIGTLFGTVIAGYLASKFNKKFALLVMTLGFSLPTLLHILTFDSYMSWVVLRLIAGTCLGGIFGTAVALICDLFPQKYRGRLTGLASSLFALAFSFGFWVSSVTINTNIYMVLILGAIIPLVGIVAVMIFVPNTDKILLENHSENNGKKVEKPSYISFIKSSPTVLILAILLSGMNFTGYSGFTNFSALYISDKVKDTVEFAVEAGDVIKQVNNEYIYVGNGEQISTGLGDGSTTAIKPDQVVTLDQANELMANQARTRAAQVMTYLGYGHFFGFLFFGYIGDMFGRKKTMLGMVMSFVGGSALLLISYNGSLLPFTLLGILMGFGFGYSGVWGAYYSELFDKKYRGMAAGFCFNMGRIVSSFTVPLIGSLVDSMGVSKALWVPLAAFLIGIIIWSAMPETLKVTQPRTANKDKV